jgi:hypothetical protein
MSISGSNENYKKFSKYGDSCQAPFQAACKLFSTSCNSSFSPPPCSCCSHFRQSFIISCACGRCTHPGSIALRELRSFLTPNPYATLCLHSCIHLSAPRHKYSFSHSIYSVPTVIPMPIINAFLAVAFVLAASKPQKNFMQ